MDNSAVFEKLSEKLVEGWQVCSCRCKDCDSAALVQFADSYVFCGSCLKYFAIDAIEDGNVVSMSNIDQVAAVQSIRKIGGIPATPIAATPLKLRTPMLPSMLGKGYAGAPKSDDVTDLIGKRMLDGWTMMAESCPICNVPLMKDKGGQILCVQCNKPVRMQGESAAPSSSPFLQRGARKPKQKKELKLKPVDWLDAVGDVDAMFKNTRRDTVTCLLEKIQAAVEVLNDSEDVEEAIQLVSLINKCSKGVTEVTTKWSEQINF